MLAVVGVEHLPELRQLAQEPERGPRHFEHLRLRPGRHADGRVAGHARQDGHLAEADAGRDFADLAVLVRLGVVDVDVELALDGDVEGVAAPVALADDLLARVVFEQVDVGADLLAVVVAPVGDDFEV